MHSLQITFTNSFSPPRIFFFFTFPMRMRSSPIHTNAGFRMPWAFMLSGRFQLNPVIGRINLIVTINSSDRGSSSSSGNMPQNIACQAFMSSCDAFGQISKWDLFSCIFCLNSPINAIYMVAKSRWALLITTIAQWTNDIFTCFTNLCIYAFDVGVEIYPYPFIRFHIRRCAPFMIRNTQDTTHERNGVCLCLVVFFWITYAFRQRHTNMDFVSNDIYNKIHFSFVISIVCDSAMRIVCI